ncbi:MAG: 2-enoate reductase, partial [Oscillospiraceae bacterium]|nr:2-enoate reductase [Oscillospiraceae bacterium]
VLTSTKALNIEKDGVTVENADGTFKLDADTVIYATGQKSLSEEAWALNDCADELHVIGDCVVPENIMAATQAAYNIALDIGRM